MSRSLIRSIRPLNSETADKINQMHAVLDAMRTDQTQFRSVLIIALAEQSTNATWSKALERAGELFQMLRT